MPAVRLDHLNRQIEALVDSLADQDVCVTTLEEILSGYRDLSTRSAGMSGAGSLRKGNVPVMVFKRVLETISQWLTVHPDQTVGFCLRLWGIRSFETSLLAAGLLRCAPLDHFGEVLRLSELWTSEPVDSEIIDAVWESVLSFNTKTESEIIEFIRLQLHSDVPVRKRQALLILQKLIHKEGFSNLPAVFRLLIPVIRKPADEIKTSLLLVFQDLARIYAHETGLALRKQLMITRDPDTRWLVIRCLGCFPQEVQAVLREALADTEEQSNLIQ